MRTLLLCLFTLGLLIPVHAAGSGADRVVKVLPFFLDTEGRIAKSPSLFDRDAYQAFLREHTNDISAVRYDVLWKAAKNTAEKTVLRVELRGVGEHGTPKLKTLETEVTQRGSRHWTNLLLGGDDYKNFGAVVAWRVSLWRGGTQLDEQTSFLW